ncbi:MAG: PP2C family protein-serine/threonine phosphatase, partial [Bdellovibrionota bacterium]
MKLRSCAISDVGKKRQKNEDSYLLNDELKLFIVADGMGGHAGGEYASRIAITTIEDSFKNFSETELKEP